MNRALLDLLRHDETHLVYGPLKIAGRVTWDQLLPPTNIQIKIDANAGEHASYALHELLHVLLHVLFGIFFDDNLEEVCIIALSDYMYTYIKADPKRYMQWTSLIDHKIDREKVSVPISDLVKRPPAD